MKICHECFHWKEPYRRSLVCMVLTMKDPITCDLCGKTEYNYVVIKSLGLCDEEQDK